MKIRISQFSIDQQEKLDKQDGPAKSIAACKVVKTVPSIPAEAKSEPASDNQKRATGPKLIQMASRGGEAARGPSRWNDLLPTEHRLNTMMSRLHSGRFEHMRIAQGEVVLDPLPTQVRHFKFGCAAAGHARGMKFNFAPPAQVRELFALIRSVRAGEVRTLVVEDGLPVCAEIELCEEGHEWVM